MAYLLSFLLLFGSMTTHKFYESLTDVVFNTESNALEVSSRFFIDDLEAGLGIKSEGLMHTPHDEGLDALIADYMADHFHISLDQKEVALTVIGFEVENDLVWIYMESEEVSAFESVEITASQLCEVYRKQENIVNFTKGDSLQSLFLTKDNTSGSLIFK